MTWYNLLETGRMGYQTQILASPLFAPLEACASEGQTQSRTRPQCSHSLSGRSDDQWQWKCQSFQPQHWKGGEMSTSPRATSTVKLSNVPICTCICSPPLSMPRIIEHSFKWHLSKLDYTSLGLGPPSSSSFYSNATNKTPCQSFLHLRPFQIATTTSDGEFYQFIPHMTTKPSPSFSPRLIPFALKPMFYCSFSTKFVVLVSQCLFIPKHIKLYTLIYI